MKKPMSLAEQVKNAQKMLNGWAPEKRASVCLEGSDIYQDRSKDQKSYTTSIQQQKGSKTSSSQSDL